MLTVSSFSDGTYHKRIKCSPALDQKIERTCDVCRKELSSALNLKQHKIAKHGPGAPEVACPVCGKHVKYLAMHVKVNIIPVSFVKVVSIATAKHFFQRATKKS